MNVHSRLCRLSLVAAGALCVLAASAQHNANAAFPDKPIHLIVPFPAGGPTDGMARLTGQQLSQALGQSVIVENRGGAGGTIATEAAARAEPDGYTLFFATTGTMAINPSLYNAFKLDPLKAFAPVAPVASTNNVLVVTPALKAKSLKELIERAKQKPGALTFGSAGNGSSNHISGELLKSMAKIDITHVPYRGSAPAFNDLLGGRISMMFDTISNEVQYIAAGKVVPLGVTGTARSEALPNVPTIAESGLPGFDVTIWFGVVAPAGTPEDAITRLHAAIEKIIARPDFKARLAHLGAQPMAGSPRDFRHMIEADTAKWSKVIKDSGASVN